jgi:hypothetical protein
MIWAQVGQRWKYHGREGEMVVEVVSIYRNHIRYRIVQNISVNKEDHVVGNVLAYYNGYFFPEYWTYLEEQDKPE